MVESYAYSAGTIINALAIGYGCAFALDLKIRLKADFDSKESILIEDGVEKGDKVLEFVLDRFKLNAVVEVESEIPKEGGLGSSSAFLNALLLAIFKHLSKPLNVWEILNLNAELSLKCGISYTGAFDDASASLLGGIVLTNNVDRKIIRWEFKRSRAVVLIPEFERGEINLERIREDVELVKRAFEFAKAGRYREAMFYNTLHYCKAIGYPIEIVEVVRDLDCFCGLSGNGPCFTAFGDVKEVKEAWKTYGRVVETKIVNEPCDDVIITSSLFSD